MILGRLVPMTRVEQAPHDPFWGPLFVLEPDDAFTPICYKTGGGSEKVISGEKKGDLPSLRLSDAVDGV